MNKKFNGYPALISMCYPLEDKDSVSIFGTAFCINRYPILNKINLDDGKIYYFFSYRYIYLTSKHFFEGCLKYKMPLKINRNLAAPLERFSDYAQLEPLIKIFQPVKNKKYINIEKFIFFRHEKLDLCFIISNPIDIFFDFYNISDKNTEPLTIEGFPNTSFSATDRSYTVQINPERIEGVKFVNNYIGDGQYQINKSLKSGASGSPVLNRDGSVCGVYLSSFEENGGVLLFTRYLLSSIINYCDRIIVKTNES